MILLLERTVPTDLPTLQPVTEVPTLTPSEAPTTKSPTTMQPVTDVPTLTPSEAPVTKSPTTGELSVEHLFVECKPLKLPHIAESQII